MLKPHHIERLRALRPTLRKYVPPTQPHYNPDSVIARQIRTSPSHRHLTDCTMDWERFIANANIKRYSR